MAFSSGKLHDVTGGGERHVLIIATCYSFSNNMEGTFCGESSKFYF